MPYVLDILPYVLDIISLVGIYVILALSLNVICGLTGLLQLGHAGFYAIGAYAAGLVCMYGYKSTFFFGHGLEELGIAGFLITGLAGMLAAAVFALIIGLPCLRLRGDYLAIATLAFGEIVRMVLENVSFPGCIASGTFTDYNEAGEAIKVFKEFGGANAISLPAEYRFDHWWVYIWIATILSFILLLNLKKSAIGRAMLAIREDEIAAKAMGVNVPLYKTLSFLICALFAGLAGALFAHQGTLQPSNFNLLLTVEILLAVVLGGLGSQTGAALGAALIVLLPRALSFLPTIKMGNTEFALGTQKELIFALLFVLLVRFVPNGIFGMGEPLDRFFHRLREKKLEGGAV